MKAWAKGELEKCNLFPLGLWPKDSALMHTDSWKFSFCPKTRPGHWTLAARQKGLPETGIPGPVMGSYMSPTGRKQKGIISNIDNWISCTRPPNSLLILSLSSTSWSISLLESNGKKGEKQIERGSEPLHFLSSFRQCRRTKEQRAVKTALQNRYYHPTAFIIYFPITLLYILTLL